MAVFKAQVAVGRIDPTTYAGIAAGNRQSPDDHVDVQRIYLENRIRVGYVLVYPQVVYSGTVDGQTFIDVQSGTHGDLCPEGRTEIDGVPGTGVGDGLAQGPGPGIVGIGHGDGRGPGLAGNGQNKNHSQRNKKAEKASFKNKFHENIPFIAD